MKALILILSAVLMGSSVFALDTLDIQSKLKPQGGHEFQAVYKSKPFLAWTGQEKHYLSGSTLGRLAGHRADDICKYFGYSRAQVHLSTVRLMDAPGEVDFTVNYIQNGKLTVLKNAGEGFLSNVVIPTVFTKVTCYL